MSEIGRSQQKHRKKSEPFGLKEHTVFPLAVAKHALTQTAKNRCDAENLGGCCMCQQIDVEKHVMCFCGCPLKGKWGFFFFFNDTNVALILS